MGECACNEIRPRVAVLVGGLIVAVEVYPGCVGCQTPMSVTLHVFTPDEAKDFGLGEMVEITTFEPGAGGWSRRVITLFGREELSAAVEQLAEEGVFDPDAYGSPAELFKEHGVRILQKALRLGEAGTPGAPPAQPEAAASPPRS